jgi:hypothetical protein
MDSGLTPDHEIKEKNAKSDDVGMSRRCGLKQGLRNFDLMN